MIKQLFILCTWLATLGACENTTPTHTTTPSNSKLIDFEAKNATPILSYRLISSGSDAKHDPYRWVLKGSNDLSQWTTIDTHDKELFCSRYQEIICSLKQPANYKHYQLEVFTQASDSLVMGGVEFFQKDILAGWNNFKYPTVNFQSLNPEAKGAHIYKQLVQNPDSYVKYHARKVAEILFFSAEDSMNDVQQINYELKDYDGISSKSGSPPAITIEYSTRHIEKSATESLKKLDFETRGVLYHELTHAYQFEPKGIGNYSNNKTFWACIEGLADAVRAQAGFFDIKTRKVGGNWMDGYRTTGFFIQWLTTKDPDAIRKFHLSVRDLKVWSFDGAIKYVFGPTASIEKVWQEYQDYLKEKQTSFNQ